jgi:flagellar basal-body rod protein FlgB
MNVTGSRTEVLTKLLDVASMRHQVIAQNVANVNTPGFRQQEVAFEQAFTQAWERDDRQAALRVQPQTIDGVGGPERVDGNNVDIDQEMSRLNKNTLLYRTVLQLVSTKLAAMRSAISGQ